MVLKITNLHILRYLPTCWLYLLECYTIDNQRCTHTASVNAIIIERFKSFIYINCLYEILIGLPSNLIRFSALSVGTLINNRLIARLAAT